MKRVFFLLTLIIICMSGTLSWAKEYIVYVTTLDINFYKDTNSGVIIKTSLCLETPVREKAILVWSGANYYSCGKLTFIQNGRSCQVDGVYVDYVDK